MMRISADIDFLTILGHLVLWIILCIFTLGIAIFFYPYSFAKLIINRCSLTGSDGFEQPLRCEIDMFSNIGHVVLWIIISILTLGIGYAFYFYKVWNYAMNNTYVGYRE